MLLDKIQSDLKQAQLERDEIKVSTMRLLLSEINYAKIKKGSDLEDPEITQIIVREVKKRLEAEESFKKGDRPQQAEKERQEGEILKTYLPAQISDDELAQIIRKAITKTGAKEISDMGKVIGVVMSQVQGQADGGRVSAKVKEILNG